MKQTMSLPLVLLVSFATSAYSMNDEKTKPTETQTNTIDTKTLSVEPTKIVEDKETTDLPMPETLKKDPSDKKNQHILVFNTVQSVVFNDITTEDLEKNKKAGEDRAAKELNQSLAPRGYLTTTLFYLRPITTLINEINSGNFTVKNHTNSQYLVDGIKSLIAYKTHENLESLHQVVSGCQKQKISIKDTHLATSVRAYAKSLRTQDESTLSTNVLTVAKNAQSSRIAIIEEFKKTLIRLKNQMEETVKQLDKDLDTACADKSHIKKATEVKHLANVVCPTLEEDGYNSAKESNDGRSHDYELSDIMQKLELTAKVDSLKERNKRTIANFTALIEAAVPKLDSVVLIHDNNNSSTQPANQQQS